MADLFDSIDVHLWLHNRRKTPVPPPELSCRSCGQLFSGGHGEYHLDELRHAGRCAYCYEVDLRRSQTGLVLDWDLTTRKHPAYVTPRCKLCGTPIEDDGGRYDIAQLCADRACAGCRARDAA